jgi:transcriptional regulator with XRE-family HTH domain
MTDPRKQNRPLMGVMITEARRKNHLSQSELAEMSGLSQSFISKIESGSSLTITVDSLIALSDTLDIPILRLINAYRS